MVAFVVLSLLLTASTYVNCTPGQLQFLSKMKKFTVHNTFSLYTGHQHGGVLMTFTRVRSLLKTLYRDLYFTNFRLNFLDFTNQYFTNYSQSVQSMPHHVHAQHELFADLFFTTELP